MYWKVVQPNAPVNLQNYQIHPCQDTVFAKLHGWDILEWAKSGSTAPRKDIEDWMKGRSIKDTGLHYFKQNPSQPAVLSLSFTTHKEKTIKAQLAMKHCKAHRFTASAVTSTGPLGNLCLWSPLANVQLSFFVFLGNTNCLPVWTNTTRFQSTTTRKVADGDAEIREQLLQKLVQQKLFSATSQITELVPKRLPLRELPPGNVASLYLMYLAWTRTSGDKGASKTTFYNVWKEWKCCLKFRSRCEHSMCLLCQSLKSAIHAATDTLSIFFDSKRQWCKDRQSA